MGVAANTLLMIFSPKTKHFDKPRRSNRVTLFNHVIKFNILVLTKTLVI